MLWILVLNGILLNVWKFPLHFVWDTRTLAACFITMQEFSHLLDHSAARSLVGASPYPRQWWDRVWLSQFIANTSKTLGMWKLAECAEGLTQPGFTSAVTQDRDCWRGTWGGALWTHSNWMHILYKYEIGSIAFTSSSQGSITWEDLWIYVLDSGL